MIHTFAKNKILCNLSVFINKSHSKKDLIKFAKIDQICYKKVIQEYDNSLIISLSIR